MPTGASLLLPLRSSPTRRSLIHTVSRVANVHGLSAPPLFVSPDPTMLRQANKTYEASVSAAAARKNDLTKTPVVSGSPIPTQNGNIIEQFKGAGSARNTSQASASNASTTANNFKTKTLSVTQYLASGSSRSHTPQGGSIASLYVKSDPFRHAPDRMERTKSAGVAAKAKLDVFFDENDFSDDENLDLDCEIPASMPSQPTRPAVDYSTPVPVATQTIPWSSSPASHFQPPQRSGTQSTSSLKRHSSDGEAEEDTLPVPQPKKRRLPKGWQEQEEVKPIDTANYATPAAKPKSTPLWNATASAVKEQKKQLKTKQTKGDGLESSDFSMDEIRNITSAHMAKNTAIALSNEQKRILDLVVNKHQSVFFTGPAGTGKSVLMRAIIAELKKKWIRDPERLAVTASTGLAACNVGGITLHSFAGIGLGKEEVPDLVRKIRRNMKAKQRWLRTKILIIDEISMVDGDLFDKLDHIGRVIRNNGRPWGGIQLVVTGDFFQLPPVPDGGQKREAKFAFDASTWNTSMDHTIGLTEVFRQKDPVFANMLNEMRLGRISEDTVRNFKALSRPLNFADGLATTELFPTRLEVERSNDTRLRDLPGPAKRFEAHDSGDVHIRDKLLQNMMAPKTLDLKEGAQVMLIKNIDEQLVNGSLGKVVTFKTESAFESWHLEDGYGSGPEMNDAEARLKQRIQAFNNNLDAARGAAEYPVVEFQGIDGFSRVLLVKPEDWKVELPNGEVQAQRTQLPLILAWALSIHKAQGQTLDRVKVDLGKVFEKGQAYVALSRATSQQGLQVLRFDKNKVMAHPRVVEFYSKLYSVDAAMSKKKLSKPPIVEAATAKNKTGTLSNFLASAQPAAASKAATANSHASQASLMRKELDVIVLDDDEEEAMTAYGY